MATPKPQPPGPEWVVIPCENVDCEEGKHFFPKDGLQIKLKKGMAGLYREPGTDNDLHLISTSEIGVVETVEPGFHQAIVNFKRGRKVWLNIEDIQTARL